MSESAPRILIVDDEKDNLDALRRLLRKDFRVEAAESGEQAVETLSRIVDFDVIVSDQRMPGMQGSEFLEHARELQPLATRILLTGFSDLEAVVDAVNRGQIWNYISKPWEPAELLVRVRQAAERGRMQRSLQSSRRELERATVELRAKDWARERLLHMLLHEFRTAPQILQGLRELDPGGPEADARGRFISNLESRFGALEQDITELMADEKRVTSLPKETLRISSLVPLAARNGSGDEPAVVAHAETARSGLAHLESLVTGNTAAAPVRATVDWSAQDVFLSFLCEGAEPLLPAGQSPAGVSRAGGDANDVAVTWAALLEPFVGAGDFAHHSGGLRTQTARVVRQLAAMGARCEFQVSGQGRRVELLVVFRAVPREAVPVL